MDSARKRELKEEYATARPPMGVVSFRCKATGDAFLVASRNIAADINSVTFKLNSGYHPNRRLLALWQEHGEDGFEISIVQELEYREADDGTFDYMDDLQELRDMCLETDPHAQKLWK